MFKADIINEAFSLLRISGLTAAQSPEDNEIALSRLESMMGEWRLRNMNLGYKFQTAPDLNSLTGIGPEYKTPLASNLAVRISPDFGIVPIPSLIMLQQSGLSFIAGQTARVNYIEPPSRMPVGSGNYLGYGRYRRYYPPDNTPPISPETYNLIVGEVDILSIDFSSRLTGTDTVAAYSITLDGDSVSYSGDTLSDGVVAFTVTADKSGVTTADIKATTAIGRVFIERRYFEVSE